MLLGFTQLPTAEEIEARIEKCREGRDAIAKEWDECVLEPKKALARLKCTKQPNGLYFFGYLQRYAVGLTQIYFAYADAITALIEILHDGNPKPSICSIDHLIAHPSSAFLYTRRKIEVGDNRPFTRQTGARYPEFTEGPFSTLGNRFGSMQGRIAFDGRS